MPIQFPTVLVLFAANNVKVWFKNIRPVFGDGTSVLIGLFGIRSVLRLVSNLILTRILAPEAFGVVAVVTSISLVMTMMSDLGLQSYIIRQRAINARLHDTVWTVRLIRNVILTMILIVGAEYFAALYSAPEVALAIQVSSGLLLIETIGPLSLFTGERDRRVLRLSVIDFVQFLLVTIITICVALIVRNYWAIIGAMFVGMSFRVYASFFLVPFLRPRFALDKNELWKFFQYVRIVIPSSILSIFLTQIDKFVLARFSTLADLGQYMIAIGLSGIGAQLISQYISRVFFPLIAQTVRERPVQALRDYYMSRRRLFLVLAIGIGGIMGANQFIVQLLFNDDYLGAGPYLLLTCFVPLAALFTTPALHVLVVYGFIRATLIANIIRLVWVFGAGYIAFRYFDFYAIIAVICLSDAVTIPYLWWKQRYYKVFNIYQELLILGAAAAGFAVGEGGERIISVMVTAGMLPQF